MGWGNTQILNGRDSRTEPWGTPHETHFHSEKKCWLTPRSSSSFFFRDLNQFNTVSERSTQFFCSFKNISWSTVWNAVLRSNSEVKKLFNCWKTAFSTCLPMNGRLILLWGLIQIFIIGLISTVLEPDESDKFSI